MSRKDIIVYSVNIGGYDTFKEVRCPDSRVSYYLFTDNKSIRSKTWNIVYVPPNKFDSDQSKRCRFIKTHPHILLPEHKISVWIDHSFVINTPDIVGMVRQCLGNKPITCYIHGSQRDRRNCLYDEARGIMKYKIDSKGVVRRQMRKYMQMGFPKNYGLFSTGFMFRKNSPAVNLFNEKWWEEIKAGSKRDQLSQMFVSWKCGVPVNPIPVGRDVYSNPFLIKKSHLHKIRKRKNKRVRKGRIR